MGQPQQIPLPITMSLKPVIISTGKIMWKGLTSSLNGLYGAKTCFKIRKLKANASQINIYFIICSPNTKFSCLTNMFFNTLNNFFERH